MSLPEKEWYIEAPWGRICIVAWGDCWNPPVLLCHGSVDTAACFRPLVQMLPNNFYYIALELPGHGRSDPFPPGLMISCYDLVYPLAVVVQHFRWERFAFVGHSLGTILGKLYNLSYPGKMSCVVNLDPLPNWIAMPADMFSEWYHASFTKYYEKFDLYNKPKEKGPVYKWEDAVSLVMKNRGLPRDAAVATLERMSEPAGDGAYRFTFDQRTKLVTRPPFSPEHLRKIFTTIPTPTLSILASESINLGKYDKTRFKLDEKSYPHGNYRVRTVEGGHDVHFTNPERVAGLVGRFLVKGPDGVGSKAKL